MLSVLSKRKNRLNQSGFSLIELLIVISIILIILAIALPKLNQAKMNAQETAALSQIQTLHKAETMYYSQFGRYATSLAEFNPRHLVRRREHRLCVRRSGHTNGLFHYSRAKIIRQQWPAHVLFR